MRKWIGATAAISALALVTACSSEGASDGPSDGDGGGNGETVTLEFAQWWEPELPEGVLRGLMDDFEEANPGIEVELLSGPYASTREQVVAGAASGTMSDVVGLDGAWVSDFVDQGSIADLTALMSDAGYDDGELASQVQLGGSTYMIPVVNFAYMLFTNDGLLADAGVDAAPSTRSEFEAAAIAVSESDENTSGWILPLSLETPNGIQNDVMSWAWASGGSMLTEDGAPDVNNPEVQSAVDFVVGLDEAGAIAPGAATLKEQDKVEEFSSGRVGMMISSLAHINTLRESSPDLDFSLHAVPAEDGYAGERGTPYASWGIGVAENSENKEEAWKLVEFLMSADANGELANAANAFPGNSTAVPEFVTQDEIFQSAFDVWNEGYPANEFVGLPVAEQLMRDMAEELQRVLNGDISVEDALTATQTKWESQF
ncbi:ABC transporter substrate-binding protein [Demequina muriae]|uniref:Sugar ABC transporter substrate-binding protein n=1 Tax=Demequina muriae TaxID=3051664 RepID=A0ABT8GER5_9MICO|nr:sugar ABC transporter substrate-binding protein [Demequina sp. EGI L300058]MDN4479751.1 sugar ABC transporter substrate-binding protein [Demequina sp. EGI L300058]